MAQATYPALPPQLHLLDRLSVNKLH